MFLEDEIISADVLAPFLSHFEFINLKSHLLNIAGPDNEMKVWKLKAPLPSSRGIESVDAGDYMRFMAISSYLVSYGYIEADLKRKKAIKQEKKKEYKNASAPWAISKAYVRGAYNGFWKLSHFETPIQKNQTHSYLYMSSLVQKRLVEKEDLRKLTVLQLKRLLSKMGQSGEKRLMKGSTRWNMVQELSSSAVVDGNEETDKFARETKANKKTLRKRYLQLCDENFEKYRQVMSDPKELPSDTETNTDNVVEEKNDITIEEFKKSLKDLEKNKKKFVTFPLKRCSENAKKLLNSTSKYMIVYRIKDDVVEKTKHSVNEIVLEYLRQIKKGSKTLKTVFGISDRCKSQRQRDRDKRRRQEAYLQKCKEKNIPIDINTQDTTDKICSSCGIKGHIRTNQECPNYGKCSPGPLQLKRVNSVTTSPIFEGNSSLMTTPRSTQISNIQKQYQSMPRRPITSMNRGRSSVTKRFHKPSQKSESAVKRRRIVEKNEVSSEDEEFVINIPKTLMSQCDNIKQEPKDLTSIQQLNLSLNSVRKAKRVQKPVKRQRKLTGCMAPFGEGPVIFQKDDEEETVKNESIVNSYSTMDNEYKSSANKRIKLEPKAVKSEPHGSSNDESDEFTCTISQEVWKAVVPAVCNKENIALKDDQRDQSDSCDEDFIITF